MQRPASSESAVAPVQINLLGGRSHLLCYQMVTRPRQGIRCISKLKVSLKRWRFEIISQPTPAHASLSGGNPVLTEHPTDDG